MQFWLQALRVIGTLYHRGSSIKCEITQAKPGPHVMGIIHIKAETIFVREIKHGAIFHFPIKFSADASADTVYRLSQIWRLNVFVPDAFCVFSF